METYKTLILNDEEKVSYIDDKEVILTPNEYNLLDFFLKNRNKIYSREDILKEVFNNSVSIRTIDTNIKRLRDKLGIYKENIITRRGFGYGFKEIIYAQHNSKS